MIKHGDTVALLLSPWEPDSSPAIEAVHTSCSSLMKKYKLVTVEKQLGLGLSYSCPNAQIRFTNCISSFYFFPEDL